MTVGKTVWQVATQTNAYLDEIGRPLEQKIQSKCELQDVVDEHLPEYIEERSMSMMHSSKDVPFFDET